MTNFDQAQTFRMGQLSGTENTQVLMFSGADIPEAPWHGMLIYRTDTQTLQVYRSSIQGGSDAFENVTGGVAVQLTFVGDTIPVSINAGDLWYDTGHDRTLYAASSAGADEIAEGEWELITGPLTIEELIANGLLASALNLSDLTAVTITGATIQTRGEADRGIKMGDTGFYIYNDDGVPFFSAVPAEGMAIIAGEGKLRSLTVSSDDADNPAGGSLGGAFEIPVDGEVTLNSRTTRPAGAPVVTYSNPVIVLTSPTGETNYEWTSHSGLACDGTYFYSSYPVRSSEGHHSVRIGKWDMTGAFIEYGEILGPWETAPGAVINYEVCGTTCDESGYVYTLVEVNTDFTLYRMYTDSMAVVDPWDDNTIAEVSVGNGFYNAQSHTLGWSKDSNRILIGWIRTDSGHEIEPAIGKFTWDISGAITHNSTITGIDIYPAATSTDALNLAGVCVDPFDFGADRIIMSTTGNNTQFFEQTYQVAPLATKVWGTNETWSDGSNTRQGFCHTGTQFASLDNGYVKLYSNMWSTTATDMKRYIASTFSDGTYETNRSPKSVTTQPKRTYMTVTASAIPSASEADRINIYGGQGATNPLDSALYLQEAGAVGENSFVLTEWAVSGANPPASNEFPDTGTPGKILAASAGFWIDGFSNGSPGTGSFWQVTVDAIAAAKSVATSIQTGTTYTPVLADAYTIIQANNATSFVLSIPTGVFSVGQWFELLWRGVGATSVSGSGVTLNAIGLSGAATTVNLAGRHGKVRLWQRATDVWVATGDVGTVT